MPKRLRFTLPDIRIGWVPLAIALSGVLFSLFPFRAQLEEDMGLGLLYALRGPESPPDNIVILGIDHESAVRLQASDDPHDWPRRLHAEILRNAQRNAVELMAFNIFFSKPSADPEADKAMADAMRDMGGAILTEYVKPRQLHSGVYMESVVEPTAELAGAALATAPFLLPKSSSGASEFLTFFGDEERRATLPTLLLLAYAMRTRSDDLAELVQPVDPGLAAFLESHFPRQSKPQDFSLVARKLLDELRARPNLNAALEKDVARRDLSGSSWRMLRSLLRVLRESEIRYFNHYGPARTFRIIPYHQLADSSPERPAPLLKGKIVLVGYLDDFQPETTEGLFYTPYSPVSSVELAATALANLLQDKGVYPAFSASSEAFWLLVWGGGLGLCAQSLSARRGLAIIAALGGSYLAAAWLLFRTQGVWLPFMIPLGWQMPAALLASLALNYRRRARREQTMQSVIHRFIPVDVFSHLTRHEDSGALPTYGRLARGVCLATDAGRYTALAETMEPMALARLMNAYYEAIFEPVTRHGGWISDVIGDAMLAIWIADGDEGKACHDALAAALEIGWAVRRFEKSHGLIFPIRMGIHCGDLHIGYVGTAERGEIRAVGDTVNTAARLEALNKLLGTQILVATQVLDGLAVDRVRPLGEFLLAGKSRPIAVAELIPGLEERPQAGEIHVRFREALNLFAEERWLEAHAAFTLLTLQFPEDGPTRFYHKTCQSYLADPTRFYRKSSPSYLADPARGKETPGIAVEESVPGQLSDSNRSSPGYKR